ncbi:hypothetical protein ABZT03_29890 [Streptomyces sp. NPDC005574]|uniref:hypothetical protein n=1 Tax=Streptomyces sp. NPDC005574 TaxID=3156891 RepID=UPI0033BCE022
MTSPTRLADTVLDSLALLAAERATGALSSERGTFFLSAGGVTHVDSPLSPGLGVLLTGSGVIDALGWHEALEEAGADLRVGRQLVDSGQLAVGALELCHLGALFDAAYFALGGVGHAPRFRPGAAHWLGAVRAVAVDTVVRESRRRRDRLQRIWPEPDLDSAPLARVPQAATGALPARRLRVLAEVDGVRTAAEIAARLACRAYPTLIELRRLAADGLVTVTARPTGPAFAALPPDTPQEEPDTALLRRLRDALEAL